MSTNDGLAPMLRLTRAHSRRGTLRGLGAGLLLAGVGRGLTGSAAAQEQTPPALALFEGETFVGTTSDPETLVAVVLAAADAAAREARAYLCNGAGIAEWLLGTLSGETLELSSDAGARLEGQVAGSGVTGTATLADGTSLTFEAVPAVGVGGLYTVSVSPHYTWGGPSAAGGRVRGLVSEHPVAPNGNRYLAVGIVAPPTGEPLPLQIFVSGNTEATGRLIVLNDAAQARGRSKGKGEHIMNWDIDF